MADHEEWEDKGPSLLPVAPKNKWEGEDEDDDVKDNWDDEDEPEVDVPKQTSSKPGKKGLAKKIAEKEAAERRSGPLTPQELLADKLAKQRLQEESDLKVALESFGVDGYSLECKEDMDKFRLTLVDKMRSIEKNPLYVGFLESTFRDLCASLDPEDIKRVSSSLTTLSNEKLKASKAVTKKKKKGVAIKAGKSNIGVYDDDVVVDEYDDFM